MAVPAAVPVKVTEHEPATSVHDAALRLPATPVSVTLTVPVGVLAVGTLVSATVKVHVEAWLIATGDVHETVVLVLLVFTVTVAVPLLPEWVESPL